tara:strand:- start:15300 stop:16607 length:1308 start_codon:yes stop_codon:yes gene_type:complete
MNIIRIKRLGKEFFWTSFAQISTLIGSFIGIRIITQLLSPTQYGELALGMTVSTLMQAIAFGPLSNGAFRFFSSAKEEGFESTKSYFATLHKLVLYIICLLTLIAIIVTIVFGVIGSLERFTLGLTAFFFGLFFGLNNLINSIQNAARNRTIVALHQTLATFGRISLSSLMIILFGASSSTAMLGYALAMIFVFLSQNYFLKRSLIKKFNSENLRTIKKSSWISKLTSYSWPFATWALLGWGRSASERWALDFFTTTKDVGIYSALTQVGYVPITLFFNMWLSFVNPVIYQRAGDGQNISRLRRIYHDCWKLTCLGFILVLFLTGFTSLFHEFIFLILLPESYNSYSYLLPAVVFAGGIFSINHHITTAIHSHNKTTTLIIPTNLLHLIGLTLNILGAGYFGAKGLVLSSIIYSILKLSTTIILSRITYRELKLV